MKKIIITIFLLVATISLLSGCITIDNPFDNEDELENPDADNPDETPEENPEETPTVYTGIVTANAGDYDTWYWIHGSNSGYIAQTFVAPQDFMITDVELYLQIVDTPMDLVVEIQQVPNTKPNTVTVTSGILDKNLLTTGWNKISLVNAQLEGGTMYAIVAGSPGMNAGPIRVMVNRPEQYANGEAFYGSGFDYSTWYLRIDEDYLFRVHGKW